MSLTTAERLRKRDLKSHPTPAENVVTLLRAINDIKAAILAAEHGESEAEVIANLRRADDLCFLALYSGSNPC